MNPLLYRKLLRTKKAPVDSSGFPPGAIGVWFADQIATKTNGQQYVPNSVVPPSTDENLIRAPRRLFTDGKYYANNGLGVVDNVVADKDGKIEASTVSGTTNQYLQITNGLTLPNATYTAAIWARSNTGTDQTFQINFLNLSVIGTFTATTTWQRFTLTATGVPYYLFMPYLSVSANIQICDAALYAGSSALTNETLVGHMYFGGNQQQPLPSYSSGVLDFSNGSTAISQFQETTFNTFTIVSVCAKVSTSALNAIIASIQDTTQLTAFADNSDEASGYYGGWESTNAVHANPSSGLTQNFWNFNGDGFHVISQRFDGSIYSIFLDDILIYQGVFSGQTPPTLGDFEFNGFGGTGLKICSAAFWSRSLSNTEVRNAVTILAADAASSGNTIAVESRIYVGEGDSISAQVTGGGGYPTLYGADSIYTLRGADYAVPGSLIPDLVTRAVWEDQIIHAPAGRKFIMSVLIGHNDFAAGATVPDFLANLAAYLDARRAAGWKIIVCTLLPSTIAGDFNTLRNLANTTIRTWVGVHADDIADFAANSTMGPDAAAADTTYYADGTHPTAAGMAILESILKPVADGLFA